MSNNTLMRAASRSIEVKSLKDLVRARSNENPVLLIDVSGSMGWRMANGKTREQGLNEVVVQMQKQRPTQMIAFGIVGESHDPTGIEPTTGVQIVAMVSEVPPVRSEAGTPMGEAIDFARMKGFGRAVVISDGAPNDRNKAMEAAKQFGGRIDVVYIGDAGDPGSIFLEQLAEATGGSRFEGDLTDVKEITSAVVGLLMGDVELEQDDDDDDEDEDEDDDDDDDDEDEDEA